VTGTDDLGQERISGLPDLRKERTSGLPDLRKCAQLGPARSGRNGNAGTPAYMKRYHES